MRNLSWAPFPWGSQRCETLASMSSNSRASDTATTYEHCTSLMRLVHIKCMWSLKCFRHSLHFHTSSQGTVEFATPQRPPGIGHAAPMPAHIVPLSLRGRSQTPTPRAWAQCLSSGKQDRNAMTSPVILVAPGHLGCRCSSRKRRGAAQAWETKFFDPSSVTLPFLSPLLLSRCCPFL